MVFFGYSDSKRVLDSGFHAVDSDSMSVDAGFHIPKCGWIRDFKILFWIPDPLL